jgi:CubicO group peptidase (beta-lactamase class C family)
VGGRSSSAAWTASWACRSDTAWATGLFGSAYGWGGWGGSLVMVEPDDRMAVAYVTNRMREPAGDTRGLEVIMTAYDGLKALRA